MTDNREEVMEEELKEAEDAKAEDAKATEAEEDTQESEAALQSANHTAASSGQSEQIFSFAGF